MVLMAPPRLPAAERWCQDAITDPSNGWSAAYTYTQFTDARDPMAPRRAPRRAAAPGEHRARRRADDRDRASDRSCRRPGRRTALRGRGRDRSAR